MPRNPYPFPRLENDDNFVKGDQKKPCKHSLKFGEDTGGDNQWNRLFRTETLSSKRREVLHFDPQAPNDSLDFVIKSTYNHHGEFLSSRAETLVQPETEGFPHGPKFAQFVVMRFCALFHAIQDVRIFYSGSSLRAVRAGQRQQQEIFRTCLEKSPSTGWAKDRPQQTATTNFFFEQKRKCPFCHRSNRKSSQRGYKSRIFKKT